MNVLANHPEEILMTLEPELYDDFAEVYVEFMEYAHVTEDLTSEEFMDRFNAILEYYNSSLYIDGISYNYEKDSVVFIMEEKK